MKVSVCIPVYNVENLIERCARSLFEQTLKDGIEFIFVDDCSPDESIDVVKRALEEYPERQTQVKFLRNARNSGQALSREAAVAVARGEYVTFCDADDWVDGDLYEKMYAEASGRNLDVVVCKTREETPDGKLIDSYLPQSKSVRQFIEGQFHQNGFNSLCNKLIRRNVIQLKDPVMMSKRACGEDLLMIVQYLLKARSIGFVDAAYHYIQSGSSSSMSKYYDFDEAVFRVRAFEKLLRNYPACVVHYKHIHLLEAFKHHVFCGRDYRKLWPEVNNLRSILSDRLLNGRRKFILCAARVAYGPLAWIVAQVRRSRA